MPTSVSVYVNNTSTDSPRGTSGITYTLLNLTNDYLIFSAGSVAVADGADIPTPAELNSAGMLITTSDVEVAHQFLLDASDNLIREIFLAGNQNKRYVYCFAFDGATASEPVLELWDDTDLDTIADNCLGEGVTNSSWFRGITTTDGLPGAGWTGKRLAGSSDNHFLWLNNEAGALSVAKDLYCNLRVTVPANFDEASAEAPVFAIKWTTN